MRASAVWLAAAASTVAVLAAARVWLRRRRLVERASAQAPLVVVVGLGGVGSHAAQLLLRAGVRRLRLVDFDQVTLSSLNRHATATRADVGTKNLKKRFQGILRPRRTHALSHQT